MVYMYECMCVCVYECMYVCVYVCMSFVIVISPTQKYLLENSLSTRLTTKVSLVQVRSVVCKYSALQLLLT